MAMMYKYHHIRIITVVFVHVAILPPIPVLVLTEAVCRFQQADTRIFEHVSASYV